MSPFETLFNARWKVATAYSLFGVACFVFFLYLTFPYQAVEQRLVAEAAANGWTVRIGSLGPGLFGVTARDVQLQSSAMTLPGGQDASLGQPGTPGRPVQLTLASVSARPALFPPGVAARTRLFGGVINGSAGFLGDLRISASASGLDPSDPMVKALSGVEAAGKLDAELSLTIPRDAAPGRPAAGFDLSHANGALSLSGSDVQVKGGTVTIPLFGGAPTPVDLPPIPLGKVDGKIKFEKGVGTLETLQAKSSDLEIRGSGTITLARRVDLSELNVTVKLKPEPDYMKRLGMLGSAFSVLPPDKQDPSFRAATLTGFLNNPRALGFPR